MTLSLADLKSRLIMGSGNAAMMTGNTVLLGLALAEGEFLAVLRSILALAGFLARAAVGALIVERDEKQEEMASDGDQGARARGDLVRDLARVDVGDLLELRPRLAARGIRRVARKCPSAMTPARRRRD